MGIERCRRGNISYPKQPLWLQEMIFGIVVWFTGERRAVKVAWNVFVLLRHSWQKEIEAGRLSLALLTFSSVICIKLHCSTFKQSGNKSHRLFCITAEQEEARKHHLGPTGRSEIFFSFRLVDLLLCQNIFCEGVVGMVREKGASMQSQTDKKAFSWQTSHWCSSPLHLQLPCVHTQIGLCLTSPQ